MANLLAQVKIADPARYHQYVQDLQSTAQATLSTHFDAENRSKAIKLLSDLTVADVALPA